MKLGDRLKLLELGDALAPVPADPRQDLMARARADLFVRLGNRLYDATLGDDELRALVTTELGNVIDAEATPLSEHERRQVLRDLLDDVLGLGPLERLLADPTVTEVMVNGLRAIWVERNGKLEQTAAAFESDHQLRRVIERIVGRVGRRVDESSPMVDARLSDGSRVNAVIPPLAVDGPALTIRKFPTDRWTVEDLMLRGTLTPQLAGFLAACVQGRINLLVSGGTGTGKTTMLNVLSSFIPEAERIVTIEDSVELQLSQEHVIRLEARPANIEGRGEVTIRDLVRNALRMRPDRIVLGEVRGGEALDMLQAMNTGHAGSLCTVHANSAHDALRRLETMVLMAGLDLPARAVREQIASAVQLVVHVARTRSGERRVAHVSEVLGIEGDALVTQELYVSAGGPGGAALPTGSRPRFTARLDAEGVDLPAVLFELPEELD